MTDGIPVENDDVVTVSDPTRHGAFSGSDTTDKPDHGDKFTSRHKSQVDTK